MIRRTLAVLMLALASLTLATTAWATKPNPEHKVTICHAHPADSITGPWVSITVDVASVGYQHQGHESEHDGDIIPPYEYTDVEGQTFSYPGKGDQSILANGCVAPDETPTPTPTPTETPPPPPPPPTTETPPPPDDHVKFCVKHPKDPKCVHEETAFTGGDATVPGIIAVALALLGGGLLWFARKLRF